MPIIPCSGGHVVSLIGDLLSFCAVSRHEQLGIEPQLDGRLWRHRFRTPVKFRPHTHDELECNVVLGGRASYIVDDARFDLRRGTLIWLHPGQMHVLVDQSPHYEMWIGVFKPRLVRRRCCSEETRPLRRRRPAGIFCKQITPDRLAALHELAGELVDREEDVDEYNAGLGYFMLRCWRAHVEAGDITPSSDVHPAVERAARIIRDSDAEQSLPDIAARAGLSASRLSRLFKQQTGVSLVQYRQRQRLARFVRIYGQGHRHTLTEAAYMAGFGSYPQFHRVFAGVFGFGPAEYRRRLNET